MVIHWSLGNEMFMTKNILVLSDVKPLSVHVLAPSAYIRRSAGSGFHRATFVSARWPTLPRRCPTSVSVQREIFTAV